MVFITVIYCCQTQASLFESNCQAVLTLPTEGEMSSLAEVGISISVLFGDALARHRIVCSLLS